MKNAVRMWRAAASVTGFLLAWELLSRSGIVAIALFPPPSRVVVSLAEWGASGELVRDLTVSLGRALAGFVLGAAAVISGIGTGRNRSLDEFLSPVLHMLRPLPPVAIIPLIIVWLGIGESAKVFAVGFAVFWPVWIAAHHGARDVPQTLIWSAQTLGVSRWKMLWRVILPGSLPFIVTGLRTGVAVSFAMVFVSELAGASSGLGYQISISHLAYRVDRMLAAMAVLAGAGAATDLLILHSILALFPWLKLTAQK